MAKKKGGVISTAGISLDTSDANVAIQQGEAIVATNEELAAKAKSTASKVRSSKAKVDSAVGDLNKANSSAKPKLSGMIAAAISSPSIVVKPDPIITQPAKPPTVVTMSDSGHTKSTKESSSTDCYRRGPVSVRNATLKGGMRSPINMQTIPEMEESLLRNIRVVFGKTPVSVRDARGGISSISMNEYISEKSAARLNTDALALILSKPDMEAAEYAQKVRSMDDYVRKSIESGVKEYESNAAYADKAIRDKEKLYKFSQVSGDNMFYNKASASVVSRRSLRKAVEMGLVGKMDEKLFSHQLDLVDKGDVGTESAAAINNELVKRMRDHMTREDKARADAIKVEERRLREEQKAKDAAAKAEAKRLLDAKKADEARLREEQKAKNAEAKRLLDAQKSVDKITRDYEKIESQTAKSAAKAVKEAEVIRRRTLENKYIDYSSGKVMYGDRRAVYSNALSAVSMIKKYGVTNDVAENWKRQLSFANEEAMRSGSAAKLVKTSDELLKLYRRLRAGNTYLMAGAVGAPRTFNMYGDKDGATQSYLRSVVSLYGRQRGVSSQVIENYINDLLGRWGTADVSTQEGRSIRKSLMNQMERLSGVVTRGFLQDAINGGTSINEAESLFSDKKDYAKYRGSILQRADVARQKQNAYGRQVEVFRNSLFRVLTGKEGISSLMSQIKTIYKTNPAQMFKSIGSAAMTATRAILQFGAIVTGVTAAVIARLAYGQVRSADERTSLSNMYNIGVPVGWRGSDYKGFESSSFGKARLLRMDAYEYQKGVLGLATALRGVGDANGNPLIRSLSDVERMYTNLTMMSRASGVNEADFNGIMVQLLQGIGKGKLDMQDIKPMLSRSGVMSDLLARYAFGLSGRGELFTELEKGRGDRSKGLTAERLVSGLLSENLTKVMDNVMRSSARTWGEVMTVVKSDLKEAVLPITSIFSDNSAAGVGSRILGLSQELAEDKVVGGELQFGDALKYAIFGNASIDVVDLVNKGFHAFGVMVDAAVLVMHVGRTVLLAAEYIKTVFGMLVGAIESVLGVVSGFMGAGMYLVSKMNGGDDTVLGKLFGSMSDGLGEAGQALWNSGTDMVESNALEAVDATRVAMDIDNILEHGSAVADVLKNTNLTGKNTAEDTPSDISSIVANTNETAKGVNEIKKNTTKMTEVQIALLKQVSGQTIVNRVSNIRPNIVANVGTIKSGVELDELIDKISDGVSREIAAYAY